MKTVYSMQELDSAFRSGESEVRLGGSFAKTYAQAIEKKNRTKNVAKTIGILSAIAGIAFAPFTFGGSLALGAVAGITAGSVTLSVAELAIICGTGLSAYAISRGYNVKIRHKDTEYFASKQ